MDSWYGQIMWGRCSIMDVGCSKVLRPLTRSYGSASAWPPPPARGVADALSNLISDVNTYTANHVAGLRWRRRDATTLRHAAQQQEEEWTERGDGMKEKKENEPNVIDRILHFERSGCVIMRFFMRRWLVRLRWFAVRFGRRRRAAG